ncbi:metallophosphoesterase [Pseudoalteromonas ulvae]|uniref:Serine/threonine protein phosphatase n=1 Tax=Pseudoalteromonas ulvae TaxID=107327 RepID=A0A244CQS0_PSEDV|nr:metallophosphoesterase [Pseudoalteromonas ulvae]OUL57945.1 serine/threonine protein phosphatase [Pseudoalteromonas ulvae]
MNHTYLTASLCAATLALVACSGKSPQTPREHSANLGFLAFGDGGYHVDYPKKKHIDHPLSRDAFIEKEKQDWLEDHRPIAEFDHAPLYVYPGTDITTEQGGAQAVGLAMTQLCRQKSCDFAIQLGDNIYPDGADANDGKDDTQRMNDLILAPLQPLFDEHPELTVYSALGNHDWKSSRTGVAKQISWMQQQPNFNLEDRGYYRYHQGEPGNDVEFFVLDTNLLLSGQHFYELPLLPDGSEQNLVDALANDSAQLEQHKRHEVPHHGEDLQQLNWLKEGLKTSTAKWKIVYGHHVLWSIGGTKYAEAHVLKKLLLPSLCQYADAYIAGHEHDLELLTDDCSVATPQITRPKLPLIISGAAAKMRGKHTPFAEQQAKRYPQYELLWSKSFTWGFAHIEIDNQADELVVHFYSTPRDGSGALVNEPSFRFSHRSL